MADKSEMNTFYELSLEQIHHQSLKSLLKAWIKAIHPMKSRTHAYARGKASAPKWWPAAVQHKGPDNITATGKSIGPTSFRNARVLKNPERLVLARALIAHVTSTNIGIESLRQGTLEVQLKVGDDTEVKATRRKNLLSQLYDVMEQEQAYAMQSKGPFLYSDT